MRTFSGCMFAALLAATTAKAHEVWKTDLGEIMWETDCDGGAIVRIDAARGKSVRISIEGLEPTSGSRGHFDGYWISINDEGMCSAELVCPEGMRSTT